MYKLLIATLLVTAGVTAAQAEPIKVGVVLDPNGKFVNIQKPIYQGIQMFMADKKDIKIELIQAEDSLSGQMKAAKEIVKKGIRLVIGHNFSSSAQMFLKSLPKKYNLAYVSPMATSLDLVKIRPGVFLCWPNNDLQVSAMAKFVSVERPKAKKIAVLINQSETYSTNMAMVFREKLGPNKEFKEISYIKGDDNLSDEVDKILAAKPDVIFLPVYSYDLYKVYESLVPKLAAMENPPIVISGDTVGKESVMSEKIGTLKAKMPSTFYFTNGWHHNISTSFNKKFVASYEKKYGASASNGAASGYEAARVMYAAIKNSLSPNPTAVNKALQTTKLNLTVGESGMQTNHTLYRPVVLMKITKSGYKYHGVY